MKFLISIVLLLCVTQTINAQVFICVDEKDRKHYSDKRCVLSGKNTTGSMDKSGTINEHGNLEIPENIRAYTSAIQVVKQLFTLLTSREPANREYTDVYKLVSEAEQRHQVFISNPDSKRFQTYSPFSAENQQRMIRSLSQACRKQGYFSICSAIEGNPWLSASEKVLRDGMTDEEKFVKTDATSCEKATEAHGGGVISDKMLLYFCRK